MKFRGEDTTVKLNLKKTFENFKNFPCVFCGGLYNMKDIMYVY